MEILRTLVHVAVKELGDRTLEIAGSTEDVDRMGDIIRAKGWKLAPFKKNPVFMWGHDYSQPPIGRATKVWVDKETQKLMFNIEFADAETYEFADTIYKLYKGGFLHATSVGFIPLEWEGKSDELPYPNWEGNVFTSQELLELSAVPVPANANALVTARESGLITVKEFEAVTREESAIEVKGAAVDETHTDETSAADDTDTTKALLPDMDEKAETYTCECVDCGYTQDSQEHCKDLVCPECGGAMKRAERPGPGKAISQAQLSDELDFILAGIKIGGLNKVNLDTALTLAGEIIKRSAGNDIPESIVDKVGAVLNSKNKGKLADIQRLAQEVIDSAASADEGEKQLVPPEPQKSAAEIARERAQEVAEVAQVVIAKLKGKRTR